jgi:TonB family protein
MKVYFSLAMAIGVIATSFVVVRSQELKTGDDPDFVPGRIVTTPQVIQPKESIESGLGGTVRVKIAIDEGGNVTSVDDVTGPGSVCPQVTRPDVVAMRNAAKEAAMFAKFTPTTRKGKPIVSSTWLSFKFPGTAEKTEFVAAPVPPSDGTKHTVKSNVNFSTASPPPPDYKGPVNSGTAADKSLSPVRNVPGQISGGVLNGKATSLQKPSYPPDAHAVGAGGAVTVQVLIDENGEVFSAQAVSGHPLLRTATTIAACEARFSPTQLAGVPVKVSGVITYNFVP